MEIATALIVRSQDELVIRIKTHIDLINSKRKIEQQAKELTATNALKDRMFSIIGHDLRSPVGAIKQALGFIVNGTINPKDEDFLETLQLLVNTTDDAFNLLENLLGWAKSQSDTLKIIPENLNLFDIVSSTCAVLKINSKKKNITINIKIPNDISVISDLNMINSILRNLLGNAIKFTPEQGLIEISANRINDFVQVFINDNGIGMEPNIVSEIFTSNKHFHTHGTNNESGSGLGLILCKDFVEKNGGQISVESKIGEGSIFSFTVPAGK